MNELAKRIGRLKDGQALNILDVLATARQRRDGVPVPSEREAAAALRAAVGEVTGPPASEDEVAKQALLVLALDDVERPALEALVNNPPDEPQTYELATGAVALVTLAVVAATTRIEVERDKEGRWSFKLEKGALAEGPLKTLLETLARYLTGSGQG